MLRLPFSFAYEMQDQLAQLTLKVHTGAPDKAKVYARNCFTLQDNLGMAPTKQEW